MLIKIKTGSFFFFLKRVAQFKHYIMLKALMLKGPVLAGADFCPYLMVTLHKINLKILLPKTVHPREKSQVYIFNLEFCKIKISRTNKELWKYRN